jgi:hypothetical protein
MKRVATAGGRERADLFLVVAEACGMAPALMEKDFWVCWTPYATGRGWSEPSAGISPRTCSACDIDLLRLRLTNPLFGPLNFMTLEKDFLAHFTYHRVCLPNRPPDTIPTR